LRRKKARMMQNIPMGSPMSKPAPKPKPMRVTEDTPAFDPDASSTPTPSQPRPALVLGPDGIPLPPPQPRSGLPLGPGGIPLPPPGGVKKFGAAPQKKVWAKVEVASSPSSPSSSNNNSPNDGSGGGGRPAVPKDKAHPEGMMSELQMKLAAKRGTDGQ